MSDQAELNKRLAELNDLLDLVEALLPSLLVHGLHIISSDPALFAELSSHCKSRISALDKEHKDLGLKIFSWFELHYPKKEKG